MRCKTVNVITGKGTGDIPDKVFNTPAGSAFPAVVELFGCTQADRKKHTNPLCLPVTEVLVFCVSGACDGKSGGREKVLRFVLSGPTVIGEMSTSHQEKTGDQEKTTRQ